MRHCYPVTDVTAPYALTVDGARMYSGLGRTRLYDLMKSGELPSFTIGSRRMFLRRELDALLDRYADKGGGA